MGTDDAADACRGVAEAVRYAGVDGITLPCNEVIVLAVDGQNHVTFQYRADLLTLVFDPLPGCRAGW